MVQIAEGVYLVPGQDEMIPDSHAYLVGLSESRDFSLVDPGLTGKGKYKLESVQKMGIDRSLIKRVILTHTHFDHIGCLAEIQKEIPGIALWVHFKEAESLEQGDERTVYGMDMFRSLCQMQYGFKPGAFKFAVDRKLGDGETLELGGMAWDVLH